MFDTFERTWRGDESGGVEVQEERASNPALDALSPVQVPGGEMRPRSVCHVCLKILNFTIE